MTRYVYGIIHRPEAYNEDLIPDGAEPNIDYAYEWFREDEDADYLTVVTLNESDYWRGWFYYNDMSDGEDAAPVEFNTQEHLDLHWDCNNGDGHYDCLRYEHLINDRIVTTCWFKDVGMQMWDPRGEDITIHHQFQNRLTTK